ncbi:MAG: NAD(P)/FAD-dependent oxidoreductase, partial [Clostridia bacterium]|nr:NAD(P)/FAD-dependent oxidoreductase [Clostridia bacterium]
GLGVRPDSRLAASAGLPLGPKGSVAVDRRMRTSVEGIWSAGDCAQVVHLLTGVPVHMALGTVANKAGRVAGITMGGGNRPFDKAIPMNASGFMGLHMITAGSYDGDTYVEDEGDGNYKKLFWKDDRLRGFILIGNVDRAGIYTSLIRERTPLSSIDFDLIKERPQLMAFSRADRAKKLGGVH